jgi:hypothetical protein
VVTGAAVRFGAGGPHRRRIASSEWPILSPAWAFRIARGHIPSIRQLLRRSCRVGLQPVYGREGGPGGIVDAELPRCAAIPWPVLRRRRLLGGNSKGMLPRSVIFPKATIAARNKTAGTLVIRRTDALALIEGKTRNGI